MSRFESSPIVNAFRKNIKKVSDPRSDHFICGVSGGVDSMTLLFLLHRHKMNCTVVHCNYRLRGEESDKDRELVEQIAAMWEFDCITATFDPEEADNQNTQAWAREKRYRAFRDIRKEAGADFILTAHHQNDQVETILQKILRGSGLPAWKGIDLREGELIRPLIGVTKQQILDFAREYNVPFREDQTNRSAEYARNFLRQELAPDMDHFFPGWRENVLKVPQRAEEFSLMTDQLLDTIRNKKNQIKRSNLKALPKKIWPVLFHRFLEKTLPDITLTEGFLNRFLTIDELQTGAEIEVNFDWKIVRDRDLFLLEKVTQDQQEQPVRLDMNDLLEEKKLFNCRMKILEWDGEIDQRCLQLDADKLDWPVKVRRWRESDRIQCLGMEGSKSVADLLTDKKISSSQKRKAFLIESFDGIISAVIFPHHTTNGQPGVISEQVKCGSATKQILQIDTDL